MVRRHRIWILKKVEDGQGKDALPVERWEKITGRPIWAGVRDEGSREFYAGEADFELSKIKVNISYRKDVSRKMRVLFHGRVYEIVRTYNGDYRGMGLDFDAERRSSEDGKIHV